jgi:hypothetical protein
VEFSSLYIFLDSKAAGSDATNAGQLCLATSGGFRGGFCAGFRHVARRLLTSFEGLLLMVIGLIVLTDHLGIDV